MSYSPDSLTWFGWHQPVHERSWLYRDLGKSLKRHTVAHVFQNDPGIKVLLKKGKKGELPSYTAGELLVIIEHSLLYG